MQNRAVFDASALLRAVVLEDAEAQRWLGLAESHRLDVICPDLVWAEIGQVLHRYVRTRRLAETEANEALTRLLGLPIVDEPLRPVTPVAVHVAATHGLSVYDAFYLALAEAADATLVTADRRLAAAAHDVVLLT